MMNSLEMREKMEQKTSQMYDHDRKVYSGRGIHLPRSEKMSSPRPVKRLSGEYESVAMPNTMTATSEKTNVSAPSVAVAVRNLTEARKLVDAVMINIMIMRMLHMKAKLAIVCTSWNQPVVNVVNFNIKICLLYMGNQAVNYQVR